MDSVTTGRPAVHRQQLAIAAGAVLATVPVLLITAGWSLQITVPCAAAVALPLLLGRHPRAFTPACVITGVTLLFLLLPLALLGMFLFLPSAVLLLLAPGAHPLRRSRTGTWLGAGVVALAVAVAWNPIPIR